MQKSKEIEFDVYYKQDDGTNCNEASVLLEPQRESELLCVTLELLGVILQVRGHLRDLPKVFITVKNHVKVFVHYALDVQKLLVQLVYVLLRIGVSEIFSLLGYHFLYTWISG